VVNPFHSRIPINLPIGVWVNISLDVLSFANECFKSQIFRSIDVISMTGNCKIRRVFTMKSNLIETARGQLDEEFPMEYAETLPKNLAMPSGVLYENLNISAEKLKYLIVNEGKGEALQADMGVLNSPTSNVKKSMALFDKFDKLDKVDKDNSNKPLKLSQKSNENTSIARSRSIATGKGRQKNIYPERYEYKMNYEARQSPDPKIVNEHKKDIKEILRNRADKILGKKAKQETTSRKSPDNKPSDNMVLLNTLNYKNIDKWENSNIEHSIEEIYELDDHKIQKDIRKYIYIILEMLKFKMTVLKTSRLRNFKKVRKNFTTISR
jgi:hypothetical protein